MASKERGGYMMKKYAFFLPQFHEIPENNAWWGQGFTEWVNVKRAKALFRNHLQPKRPLNENYYNLLDKDTVQWQTDMMRTYGVDGLIYYHYYFTGKKLLEKPAENLLQWKDVEQNFFFCWANHTWYRSWNNSKEVLIEQEYGREEEWEVHFNYLLPFFLDSRYEKRENKPVFMIYEPDFAVKNEMFDYFDNRCRENGFDGLCLIETYSARNWPVDFEEIRNKKSQETEFFFLREPALSQFLYLKRIQKSPIRVWNKIKRTLCHRGFKTLVAKYDGNALYKLQQENYFPDKEILHGLFFEWDNTPRHKERGYIITPVDKKNFLSYMEKIKHEEYVFINAWNEWAEGMMLEPTEEKRYQYLEWMKEWRDMYENNAK